MMNQAEMYFNVFENIFFTICIIYLFMVVVNFIGSYLFLISKYYVNCK